MRTRTLTRAATAAATLALLTTATATATATAAPAPGFLEADDLPPHASSPWHAGEVTRGLPDPEPFCMEGAVPDKGATHHRSFGTDYDTHAVQIAVTTASPKAAAALADRLEARAANCAADWLRENPGASASWDDYGTVEAGESAHVFGVHTAPPESEHGVNLFAVVSKGKKVTVVRWAQMGTLEDAPVDAFRMTTTKAAARL
ncbi:hypothetical protein MMF93_06665 [Streptomyces tubbatahanensis]|uniref:PknH-like extracellular domain-containing protein n=1 Tax=Streptomyces tubbatahanensis TaxID=2923272 RepID=A0ABY3XPU3_9ACTN|nr:hypothetical protein [Streptomyces tubbatahanensis]UNS96218.1 hypothetical protein MMF93_06665 [Streptomyces tubbatahanensis]